MEPVSAGPVTTSPAAPIPTISPREQGKIEFYRTYDVMTGVRIAATLGGFFGLMVILVVYKSKSKTEKVLTDPKLAAAVVEAEEERQLEALEAAAEYRCLNPRVARLSLAGMPQELGGRRGTSPRLLLDVPSARRPSSAATNTWCSSSDSSYLERRGSAVALGLAAAPAHRVPYSRRRQSSPAPAPWDLYYPIDIRVIQPTPGGSPCGSERALYKGACTKIGLPKLAPLASISSCASSLVVDYPDLDARSFGSDSVFLDDEECADTDDEITQFSTDSDTDTVTGGTEFRLNLPMADRGGASRNCGSSSVGSPTSQTVAASGDCDDRGSWSQETLF